ncbi:Eco57I restriction-modification methylase domain-containing protein, partial [bacterium]|nr:Eco57I restriction-modification methylase domain-containing protein [bacterium]
MAEWGTKTSTKAKDDLEKRLAELNEELNHYLAKEYGKDPDNKPAEYEAWKKSHQPFHWLAEFYEIIHGKGGFDVIIGNPPYVEYSAIKNIYDIQLFKTKNSGNLYAYIIERSIIVQKDGSFNGMIIPISAFCT